MISELALLGLLGFGAMMLTTGAEDSDPTDTPREEDQPADASLPEQEHGAIAIPPATDGLDGEVLISQDGGAGFTALSDEEAGFFYDGSGDDLIIAGFEGDSSALISSTMGDDTVFITQFDVPAAVSVEDGQGGDALTIIADQAALTPSWYEAQPGLAGTLIDPHVRVALDAGDSLALDLSAMADDQALVMAFTASDSYVDPIFGQGAGLQYFYGMALYAAPEGVEAAGLDLSTVNEARLDAGWNLLAAVELGEVDTENLDQPGSFALDLPDIVLNETPAQVLFAFDGETQPVDADNLADPWIEAVTDALLDFDTLTIFDQTS